MHVFTYGTLMYPEVWQTVVGQSFETVGGTIPGYANFRVRNEVFPGILAAGLNKSVRGLVYLDVDEASIKRLDVFEGDLYDRLSLQVTCEDGHNRTAGAYVIPEKNRYVLTDELWHGEEFIARGHLEEFIRRYQGFSRLAER